MTPDYGGATDAELAEIRSWYASGDWPVIEARLIREIVELRRELAETRQGMESANGVAAFRTPQLLEGQAKAAALLADHERLKHENAELRQGINFLANLSSAYWVKPMNGHGWRLIETDCGAMLLCGEGSTPCEAVAAARRAS